MAENPLLHFRRICSCVFRTSAIPGGRPHFRHPWRSQWLRSALYNLIMFGSVLFFAPLAVLTFPFSPIARYRFISQWARFQLWLIGVLCGLYYRVEGREHLPQKAAIVLAKHQSTWETFALQEIFPPQVWVLKHELLWVPLFGWALKMLDPIAIDRGAGRRAVQQIIDQGRQRLESGRWVVIFPEGTRVAPGHHRRFGIGGAVLAAETGHPVVPVAHNAGSYWPRRGFVKQPGTIRLVIGPAIDSRGKTAEEINRAAEAWIQHTMREIEAGPARS
jgi:1-acyl-sn-glycerol-3-phosphate acyltransferase